MGQEKNDRIVCLFGSGISIPTGMPSARQISETILDLKTFFRYTDGRYFLGVDPIGEEVRSRSQAHEREEAIRILIRSIRDLLREDRRHRGLSSVDLGYEDVLFIVQRLWDEHAVPLLDPALRMLRRQVEGATWHAMKEAGWEWWRILYESDSCMKDVVWQALSAPIREPCLPLFLDDLIDRFGPDRVVLVTTNHDLVLERRLVKRTVIDGFRTLANGGQIWSPETFDIGSPGIRLFKVHGSIDWFGFVSTTQKKRFILRTHTSSIDFQHPEHGSLHKMPVRPLILLGTYDKMPMYARGEYAELFFRARRMLMGANNLVVCGYGFRDLGINRMIWDWASSVESPKLFLVHRDYDKFRRGLISAHPGVVKELNILYSEGTLVPIERTAETLRLEDLENLLAV